MVAIVGAGLAVSAAPASAAAPIGPGLFGLHVNDLVGHYPTVPFGTIRLWDAGVTWRDLEPSPGKWNFAHLDEQVARARAARKDIVMVLGVTPRWASKRPNEDAHYGKGAAAEPKDLATWRNYVKVLATRYHGKINKWELYNEPNAVMMYSGTIPTMVAMAQQAWIELRRASAGNFVISPGVVTRTTNSPKWLDTYLRIGGARYANAIGAHFYVKARERPEDTLRYLAIVRGIMRSRGVSQLPLWNTESGYGRWNPTDPATHEIYSGTAAMAYVARTYLLMASGGVARSYWYGWDQRYYTGLFLTTDGSRAGPAGRAYGVTYTWLVGSTTHGCVKRTSGALAGGFSCELTRGTTRMRVLWHPDGSRQTTMANGFRSLHRLDGSKVPVDDSTRFTVSELPVMISTAP
ncbi:MAG: hypothetical protein ABIM89_02235 [Mycobacteriales bacterium]